MNQILDAKFSRNKKNKNYCKKHLSISNIKVYKIQFIFFSIIAIILVFFLFIKLFKQNKQENISQKLLNLYSISTLYSNDNSYTTNSNFSYSDYKNNTPFVIGMLKINKININYPILSETTDELLEISICRFAGPLPNQIGNLCIAGHNYVDYKLFSRLHELEIGDNFEIYDLNGKMINYKVFDKYEVNVNDTSCTFQNTSGKKIVTLVTCNNVNGKRLIVVGQEK